MISTTFPSPCGVNIVGNMSHKVTVYVADGSVSVPLRGKYCREFSAEIVSKALTNLGFRPLAG